MQERLAKSQAAVPPAPAAVPPTQAQRMNKTQHTPPRLPLILSTRQEPNLLPSMMWLAVLLRTALSCRGSPTSAVSWSQWNQLLKLVWHVAVTRLTCFRLVMHFFIQKMHCCQLPQHLPQRFLQQHLYQALQLNRHHAKSNPSQEEGGGGRLGTQLQKKVTAAQGRAVSHSPGGSWTLG